MTDETPVIMPPAPNGGKRARVDTKAAIARERENRLRRACLHVCWGCGKFGNCGSPRGCPRTLETVKKFDKENA